MPRLWDGSVSLEWMNEGMNVFKPNDKAGINYVFHTFTTVDKHSLEEKRHSILPSPKVKFDLYYHLEKKWNQMYFAS